MLRQTRRVSFVTRSLTTCLRLWIKYFALCGFGYVPGEFDNLLFIVFTSISLKWNVRRVVEKMLHSVFFSVAVFESLCMDRVLGFTSEKNLKQEITHIDNYRIVWKILRN